MGKVAAAEAKQLAAEGTLEALRNEMAKVNHNGNYLSENES